MKPGTPGFVPERLREARIARGLSVSGLAERLPVSRQAVTNYENGTNTPQPDVLSALSSVLDVPASYFLRSYEDRPLTTLFFRSLESTPKYVRESAGQKLVWLKRLASYLQQFVVFPEVNLPRLDEGRDPLRLSASEVEDWAQRTRRHWGLGDGPISDVTLLLENNGITVSRFALLDRRIDGFSEWSFGDGRPYVVLNEDKESSARSRFDAAHELAHLVLHRDVSPSEHSIKRSYKALEEQAHRFAGAFLLPAETFTRDFYVPNVDVFLALKEKWRVSVKAMIYRCVNLGILNGDTEKRLWVDYSRRKWQRGEPLDNAFAEEPRFMRRSVEMLEEAGVQTANDVLDALALPPHDVEGLGNLRAGYLTGRKARIVEMPQLTSEAENRATGGTARIHTLPGRDRLSG